MEENTPTITPEKNSILKKYGSLAWEIIKILLFAAIIVLPIRYFIFQPFIVKGDSMVPNLHPRDYLIVDEISYRFSNPQRGDVIVFKYPVDNTQRYIKRIIGLPGETVDIANGKVTIIANGKNVVLDEKKYLLGVLTDGTVHIVLENDNYFVMGDNRPFSYDSRRWGVLPKDDIIGRALFRLLPISQMSVIFNPTY